MKCDKMQRLFLVSENIPIFAILSGAMAERLGTGLQNLVQRFDSASHLKKPEGCPFWLFSALALRANFLIRGAAPNVLLWGLCPQNPRGSLLPYFAPAKYPHRRAR